MLLMFELKYSPPLTRISMLARTMHFSSWIYHSMPFMMLMILSFWPHSSAANEVNAVLTSTPFTVTLSFEPNPAATNYTASFHVSTSPFLNDIVLEPPYNGTGILNATYDAAYPGFNYTVTLYENETSMNDTVFTQHIATVPLAPINPRVEDKGTSFLLIAWDSVNNISYSSHRIYYRLSNESTYQTRQGTADELYTLDGLQPGYMYIIYITAIAFDVKDDKESVASTIISNPTLPSPPTNLTAEAENTTHITITWMPQESSFQDSFEVTYLVQGTNRSALCQESPCSIVPPPPAGQEVVVFVSAVSHQVASIAEQIKTSTEPDPVAELKAKEGVRSLELSWKVPSDAAITSFHIRVVNIRDNTTVERTKEATAGETLVTYSVSSLLGGSAYQVYVAAETPYARGEPKTDVFQTIPEPVSELEGMPINTTALQLSWKNPRYTVIDMVIIEITKPDGSILELKEDKDTQNREVINLVPGETYQVSVFIHTPLTPKVSEASNVTVTIKPIKPKLLSSISGEKTLSIVLAREEDIGDFSSIQASINSGDMQSATNDGVINFDGLEPGTEYAIDAVTFSGQEKSAALPLILYTKPQPPEKLEIEVVNSTVIRVVWDAPDQGGYDNFIVSAEEADGGSQKLTKMTPDFEVYFTEIMAGTTFNVSVVTVKGDQQSTVVSDQNTTVEPKIPPEDPESVAALQKVDATENTITVNWTDPAVGDFNFYNLGIKEEISGRESRPLLLPRSNTNYTYERLLPGKVYLVAIRTVLRLQSGRQRFGILVRLRAVTKPLPVDTLQLTTLSTTSLQVNWTTNETSSQDKFLISYEGEGTLKTTEVLASNTSQEYDLILDQLLSGTMYKVTVVVIRSISTDSEDSLHADIEGYTKPDPASNLTLIRNPDSTVTVTWTAPPLGSLDNYRIRYRPILRDPNSEFQMSTSTPTVTSKRLVDLFPGEKYEVQVVALRHDLESEAVSDSIVLKPLEPASFIQNKEKTTTDSVTVQWSYNSDSYFSEKWIITYTDGSISKDIDEITRASGDYNVFITGLEAGQTYTVTIKSQVLNMTSAVQTLTVTAKPFANTDIVEISTTNNSITFDYSVKLSDLFDQFLFSVDPNHTEAVRRLKNESLTTATISGLTSGMQYMLYAFTQSKSELSSGFVSLEFITDPNPVPVSLVVAARQITVRFGAQQGGAAEYSVTCIPDCGNRSVPSGTTEITFPNLNPYSTYFFNVVTKTINVPGIGKEVTREYQETTQQAAPSIVPSLTVTPISIHSVRLSWDEPSELNGVLTGYIVSYRGTESTVPSAPVHENIFTLSAREVNIELQGLNAGYTYTFQVFARTVADGAPRESSFTMKTAPPTFKSNITPESSKPAEPDDGKDVTQNSISLKFVNPFSAESGYVRHYSVIVSRDPDVDDSSTVLKTWEEAKKDKDILVYEAVTKCKDFFTTGSSCGQGSSRKRRAVLNDLLTRMFVVGAETGADCEGQASCNGPLSEGTSYYVKLRGFTESGQYTDTAYSEKIKTEKESSASSGKIGGIVGGLIAVFVGVGVVVFVIIRRRRRPKKATKHAGPKAGWEQSSLNKFSRPVKLLYFPDHVRKMAADSDFKYAEEYEDLKETGRDQPTLAAEFPPNRPKNRFTNILPYDHSRVKLLPTADDEEGSDYINANYMPGYNSKREYIATQGPLPATRDDFWRMLWEQSSRNIVMLTRCQEKGREKSDHYWPSDSEPKFYGDLQVVILNETHMPDWTIVEFKVSHGDQSRQVRHFHYRVWPDFGVPKDPASLIRFVRTVREKLIREGGPIVLHCSAGVGRSGTFIVLDHLLQLIREKDEVDIFSIVYKLRKERVLMVQTEQQYKFIHECLLCVLENRENDTTYANLGQINVGFEDDEGINLEAS